MEYVCRVGTPSGEVVERTFSASDERALRTDLEQQGYYLLAIRRGLGISLLRLRPRRVNTALLLVFAQELAALLKAGLPLFQSLDIMLERQRDPVFRDSLGTVREKVKSGVALSDAIQQEGELYPPIFPASLVAGERSGSLDGVLRRFAQHLRLNQALKKKAISASIYPMVLLTMMAVLLAVLLVYVIPQFQSFFEGLGAELPLPTRILMAVAGAARANIMWILLGGATGRIREGASLTAALESTDMLEALPLEMVKVGEQTGALGDMLDAIADFYDEELDTRMAAVLSLVEPVLLVLMAVIVAGMLLAFYLPMFQAISAVQGAG
jgi:type IV pilus assembly protein PilC